MTNTLPDLLKRMKELPQRKADCGYQTYIYKTDVEALHARLLACVEALEYATELFSLAYNFECYCNGEICASCRMMQARDDIAKILTK